MIQAPEAYGKCPNGGLHDPLETEEHVLCVKCVTIIEVYDGESEESASPESAVAAAEETDPVDDQDRDDVRQAGEPLGDRGGNRGASPAPPTLDREPGEEGRDAGAEGETPLAVRVIRAEEIGADVPRCASTGEIDACPGEECPVVGEDHSHMRAWDGFDLLKFGIRTGDWFIAVGKPYDWRLSAHVTKAGEVDDEQRPVGKPEAGPRAGVEGDLPEKGGGPGSGDEEPETESGETGSGEHESEKSDDGGEEEPDVGNAPVLIKSSVLSFPDRGPYGDNKYRGNTSGRVVKALLQHYRPANCFDPMEGGGTSRDVCKELGIPYAGRDITNVLGSGGSETGDSEADGPSIESHEASCVFCAPVDFGTEFIFWHPPYHSIIKYGEKSECNLSTQRTLEGFFGKAEAAFIKLAVEYLLPNGHIAVQIGDLRKSGKYTSMLPKFLQMGERLGLRLDALIIKAQHKVTSSGRRYASKKPFIPIMHEYILVWEKVAKKKK